jgi:signal transduction histidine kinase
LAFKIRFFSPHSLLENNDLTISESIELLNIFHEELEGESQEIILLREEIKQHLEMIKKDGLSNESTREKHFDLLSKTLSKWGLLEVQSLDWLKASTVIIDSYHDMIRLLSKESLLDLQHEVNKYKLLEYIELSIFAFVILFTSFGVIGISKRVISSVNTITGGLKKFIRYNESNIKINLDGNDEFSYIAASINQVMKEKKTIEQRLLEYQSNLEEKVSEQTIKIEKARITAEDANVRKSDFLAEMSHDLRTPLHGILYFSDYGTKDIKINKHDKLEHYFLRITQSGNRLMAMLNELLDLSKLESGRLELNYSLNDIAELMTSIIKEFEPRFNQKNINIILTPSLTDSKIICDHGKISQVIENILSNALEYTQDNKKIFISIEQGESFLGSGMLEDKMKVSAIRISVENEGEHIPGFEHQKIFERFKQSNTTLHKPHSAGLGLAICQEIINLHHGRIWAENTEVGVKISFLIPDKKIW